MKNIIIKNEQIVCTDIDGTLVTKVDKKSPDTIKLKNPYSKTSGHYKKHNAHIELIKQYRGRKNFIIAWSAGGVLWTQTVIKALELEKYVDLILTKPGKYVDDLDCSAWMGTRIFLKDE